MLSSRFVVGLFVVIAALGLAVSGWAAEEGITDTEILIGSHQDLSGPIAAWGIQVKNGMDMRAREINEAGGIYGRKITIIFEDNKYDPKTAIMVTNKLIERDKVFSFVGNMGSPTAGATLPLIIEKKIPHTAPLTAATMFYEPLNRYSFMPWVPYYAQSRDLIKYFVEERKYKKIGVMYQDDEMGDIMVKGLKDQLAVYKLQLAAAESYKRGATEFSAQIANLQKAGVELVVLATVIRETVGALKQANKVGWKVDMVGMTPAFTTYVPKLAGEVAEGFYCIAQTPIPYPDSEDPFISQWAKKYEEWYKAPVDTPVTAGYYAISEFAEAAKRAGKDLTREKLIDALETFRDVPDSFGGTPITYTKTSHLGNERAFMAQVKNGKYVKISGFISYK